MEANDPGHLGATAAKNTITKNAASHTGRHVALPLLNEVSGT
jgi:hypothetical protein